LRVQRKIGHDARVYERQSLGVFKRTGVTPLSTFLGNG
jgi:hypothetical protein